MATSEVSAGAAICAAGALGAAATGAGAGARRARPPSAWPLRRSISACAPASSHAHDLQLVRGVALHLGARAHEVLVPLVAVLRLEELALRVLELGLQLVDLGALLLQLPALALELGLRVGARLGLGLQLRGAGVGAAGPRARLLPKSSMPRVTAKPIVIKTRSATSVGELLKERPPKGATSREPEKRRSVTSERGASRAPASGGAEAVGPERSAEGWRGRKRFCCPPKAAMLPGIPMAKHLQLVPQRRVSSFRKLAIGSWRTAHDPTVYGTLTVRVDAALGFLEAFRARTGVPLQLSHLVVRAVAEALRRCPEANAVLRFNRLYLRQRVDVSLLVPSGEGAEAELLPAKLEAVDGLGLAAVAEGLARAAERAQVDPALARERRLLGRVPFLLLRPFTRLASFLQHTLNLDLGALGLVRDPFGSAAVVDVGALGVDTAYLPLVPHAHVPIVVAVGAVREVPLVQPDGQRGGGSGAQRQCVLRSPLHRRLPRRRAGAHRPGAAGAPEDFPAGKGPQASGEHARAHS